MTLFLWSEFPTAFCKRDPEMANVGSCGPGSARRRGVGAALRVASPPYPQTGPGTSPGMDGAGLLIKLINPCSPNVRRLRRLAAHLCVEHVAERPPLHSRVFPALLHQHRASTPTPATYTPLSRSGAATCHAQAPNRSDRKPPPCTGQGESSHQPQHAVPST
jgi:hypothetical protein